MTIYINMNDGDSDAMDKASSTAPIVMRKFIHESESGDRNRLLSSRNSALLARSTRKALV